MILWRLTRCVEFLTGSASRPISPYSGTVPIYAGRKSETLSMPLAKVESNYIRAKSMTMSSM